MCASCRSRQILPPPMPFPETTAPTPATATEVITNAQARAELYKAAAITALVLALLGGALLLAIWALAA